MSNIHQGIDIVDVTKFSSVVCRHDSFILDIFTDAERRYCMSRREPHREFAGFFAAKESYLKALGTGFRAAGVDHVFRDIEVSVCAHGTYEISASGWAARIANARRVKRSRISISHAPGLAVAWTVLVSAEVVGPEGECVTF